MAMYLATRRGERRRMFWEVEQITTVEIRFSTGFCTWESISDESTQFMRVCATRGVRRILAKPELEMLQLDTDRGLYAITLYQLSLLCNEQAALSAFVDKLLSGEPNVLAG